MRARRSVLALVAALGVAGCAASPGPTWGPTGNAPAEAAAPTWLPPYTPEQIALLVPSREPVPVPAHRTYPDPASFRHARDRQLEDPREAMQVTRMVAEVVDRSPRMYAIADAGPDVANLIAQYGPAASGAPDPWMSSVRDPGGVVRLVKEPVSDVARASFDEGTLALKDGHPERALAAFERAKAASPRVPAIRLGLARALEAQGKPELAEAAYRELVAIDPTLGTTHERLAAVLFARGDLPGARRSLAHALAYDPPSVEAHAMIERLAASPPAHVDPFVIFLDVDSMGAIRVATGKSSAARMYAGCRAVMRYEPELRGMLFDQPEDAPYFLSAAEEMLCLESAIGAFVADRVAAREEGRAPPEDAQAMGLLGIAHTEGLLGYVMFEIIGQHRPEHARTAPLPVHRATVAYIRKYVLGDDPEKSDALFVADAR
jgi:tetratricopeptide (TPR) repeat protein